MGAETINGDNSELVTELNHDHPRKEEEEEEANIDDDEKKKIKKQVHFVFVHGISHGGWCWYKIKSLMENSGDGYYRVTCIDLKSGGIDQTDPNTIFTLDDYNKPLLDFLASLPDDEKVFQSLSLFNLMGSSNFLF